MTRDPASGVQTLVEHGVVAVVRTPDAALASTAVAWLREAGVCAVEITMTIPGALDVMREVSREPDLVLGAGTVLDAADAVACLEAGARFVVSPALCEDAVAPCKEAGVPCVLGAATPSEVLRAVRAGSSAVKIFPVSSLGGVSHVKALKAVFPDVALAPTGGIGVDAVGDYLAAGAAFVGVGGRLVDVAALRRGDRPAIQDAARTALAQVAAVRGSAV